MVVVVVVDSGHTPYLLGPLSSLSVPLSPLTVTPALSSLILLTPVTLPTHTHTHTLSPLGLLENTVSPQVFPFPPSPSPSFTLLKNLPFFTPIFPALDFFSEFYFRSLILALRFSAAVKFPSRLSLHRFQSVKGNERNSSILM